jgi:glycerol-3-phosphate O-acyltransferase
VSLATALQDQLAHNPWPPSAEKVIFLLDTTRRFERQLLEQWIALHDKRDIGHTIVLLDLRDDRKTLDIAALSEALKQHPNATVAPLRVSWVQAERSTGTGPRLRDVLRGGERRPPGWLADRVARLNPERVHLAIGEPGSNRDLGERFQAKTGLSDANEPGDFAIFVARQAAVVIDIAERQLIGGRYKVPRYVHQSIRNNRAFRAGLLDIANAREQPTKAVRAEASEYLREMISIPTRFWLDVWAKLCGICLGLGYEKAVHYDPNDL